MLSRILSMILDRIPTVTTLGTAAILPELYVESSGSLPMVESRVHSLTRVEQFEYRTIRIPYYSNTTTIHSTIKFRVNRRRLARVGTIDIIDDS